MEITPTVQPVQTVTPVAPVTPVSAVTPAIPARTFTCHDSLTRFFQRVRTLFSKQIPAFMDAHIAGVLAFVESVKSVVNNPTLEGILDSLAPKMAPAILSAIQDNIDKVIDALEIEIACKSCTTFEDKIKCIADQIATKSPELQTALLHAMAVILSRLTSQNVTMTETELAALVSFTENELAHAATVTA
jgi:hypothetical protein